MVRPVTLGLAVLAFALAMIPVAARADGEQTLIAPGFSVGYRRCDGGPAEPERLTLPRPLGSRYTGMHARIRAKLEDGRPSEIELLEGQHPLLEALRWHIERARFAAGAAGCVELAYRVTATVLKADEVIAFRVWLDATLAPDGRVESAAVVGSLGSGVLGREIERQALSFATEPVMTAAGPVRAETSLRVAVRLEPDGWASYRVTTRLLRRGARPLEVTSPPFPRPLADLAPRGRVLLEFMVASDGRPVRPRVVEASPVGVFDAAALDALDSWRFQPDRVDGKPVPTGPVQQVIVFDPGRAPTRLPALPAGLEVSGPER